MQLKLVNIGYANLGELDSIGILLYCLIDLYYKDKISALMKQIQCKFIYIFAVY